MLQKIKLQTMLRKIELIPANIQVSKLCYKILHCSTRFEILLQKIEQLLLSTKFKIVVRFYICWGGVKCNIFETNFNKKNNL